VSEAVVRVRLALELSPSQARALAVILTSRVAILTGGPGTGKTSLVTALASELRLNVCTLSLASPVVSTGSPGSATEVMAFRIIEAAGLDKDKDMKRFHRDSLPSI